MTENPLDTVVTWACTLCTTQFPDKDGALVHVKTSHKVSDTDVAKYVSPIQVRDVLGQVLTEQTEYLANEAFKLYEKTIQTSGNTKDTKQLAIWDFTTFYINTMVQGYRGIRWNFNGCILCSEDEKMQNRECRRILLAHKDVLEATDGRPLGTVICMEHGANRLDDLEFTTEILAPAAVKRVLEEPPEESQ